MNGAVLYWLSRCNTAKGMHSTSSPRSMGLRPAAQKVGLLLDKAIEPELRLRHMQAADACRATLGVNVGAVVTTDEPLGVELRMSPPARAGAR